MQVTIFPDYGNLQTPEPHSHKLILCLQAFLMQQAEHKAGMISILPLLHLLQRTIRSISGASKHIILLIAARHGLPIAAISLITVRMSIINLSLLTRSIRAMYLSAPMAEFTVQPMRELTGVTVLPEWKRCDS